MENVIKFKKMRKLRDSVLKKLFDFKSKKDDPWFQRAVDFFVISYLAEGMNQFDLLTLKGKNWKGNTISYQRKKVGRKEKDFVTKVNVSKELAKRIREYANKDITEDGYIFPFINPDLKGRDLLAEVRNFVKTMGDYLEKVSKMLRIKKLTPYQARHAGLRSKEILTSKFFIGKYPTLGMKDYVLRARHEFTPPPPIDKIINMSKIKPSQKH